MFILYTYALVVLPHLMYLIYICDTFYINIRFLKKIYMHWYGYTMISKLESPTLNTEQLLKYKSQLSVFFTFNCIMTRNRLM